MVNDLVLEEEEPVFVFAVNVHLDFYGTQALIFNLESSKIGVRTHLRRYFAPIVAIYPRERRGLLAQAQLYGEIFSNAAFYQVIISLHASIPGVKVVWRRSDQ